MSASGENQKVAIIGSGFIGRSWAMLFAGAGFRVCLYDLKAEQLQAAMDYIQKSLHHLKENDLLRTELPVESQLAAMSTTTDLAEAMKDAVWAQESVFEDVNLKRELFGKLDTLAGPDTILASSTSCILPSLFAVDLKHAHNAIVAHPTNPPYFCPATEIVPSKKTCPATIQKTVELMRLIGQKPVIVKKEVPGFVLNRMQYILLAECWRLIRDGVADVEDVDTLMTDGLGMRYAFLGPMAVTHLNAQGIEDYCEKYNAGYLKVTGDMGPSPSWSGELLAKVKGQLEEQIPAKNIGEKIAWRDAQLAALSKLKRKNEKQ